MSWFNPRAGISECFSRLFKGIDRIAYIGDSVIAQRDGFRPLIHEWLCQRFGHNHIATNACLGSNGGICSLFVMDELILKHKPALCIVQCSVGDMAEYTPAPEVTPVMEGIVRKLASINTPLIFIHMYRNDQDSVEASRVISDHEAVAQHYSIPSINVGLYLKELFLKNEFRAEQLFKDGIHTNHAGAQLSAQIITDVLKELIPECFNPGTAQLSFQNKIQSQAYLHERRFDQTSLIYCKPEMSHNPALSKLSSFRFVYPVLEVGIENPISYRTNTGEIIGMLTVLDRNSGTIEVRSSLFNDKYLLLDQWCDNERIKAIIFRNYVPQSQTLEVELLDCLPEKHFENLSELSSQVPKTLRIIGFLVRHIDTK